MKTYTFTLTNENIDRHLQLIRDCGSRYRAEKRMLIRSCLALEEIMLNYQAQFGTEQPVTLKLKKRFGNFVCLLSLQGTSCNPLDAAHRSSPILDAVSLAPRYSYSLGVNQITVICHTNQGGKELRRLLLSVMLGVLLGIGGRYLPQAVLSPALSLVNALSDAIFGLMKMVALPVVFLCVLVGVLGSGTIHRFRQNGVRVLRRFFLSMLAMLLFVTAVSVPAFGIRIATAPGQVSAADTLIDTVFSLIPDNPLSPFVQGDNVKVILLGVLFGCGLLTLGDRAGTVSQCCFQLKEVCSTVMSWVGKLIPLLIVAIIAGNVWSGQLSAGLFSAWKIPAVFLLCCLLILLITLLRTARRCRIPCRELLAAVLVPGMKGLISSSTMFCYSDMSEGLKQRLHIPAGAVDFGIPLGCAFYQPTTLMYAVFVLYFAAANGVTVSVMWLLSFLLICFVTGIAVPPVSGGALTLLAVLFISFGIPESSTAMALPLMMLLDYPNTAFRVMMLMMEVAAGQSDPARETQN